MIAVFHGIEPAAAGEIERKVKEIIKSIGGINEIKIDFLQGDAKAYNLKKGTVTRQAFAILTRDNIDVVGIAKRLEQELDIPFTPVVSAAP
jgi:hypothetical protein